MLDVHPPHEAAHSWSDFAIHIATIVVGLLIAVSLEQSVEWLHHRKEVREVRRALAIEKKINEADSGLRTDEFKRFTVVLEKDLEVFQYLRKHPGAPPEQWPGTLSWQTLVSAFKTSAWDTAVKSNVVAYMPQAEVRTLTSDYALIEDCRRAQRDLDDADQEARSYAIAEPDPSKLTPDEIDTEIKLVTRTLRYQSNYGRLMVQMADGNPGFHAPDPQEIRSIVHAQPNPEVDRDIRTERDRWRPARTSAAAADE